MDQPDEPAPLLGRCAHLEPAVGIEPKHGLGVPKLNGSPPIRRHIDGLPGTDGGGGCDHRQSIDGNLAIDRDDPTGSGTIGAAMFLRHRRPDDEQWCQNSQRSTEAAHSSPYLTPCS